MSETERYSSRVRELARAMSIAVGEDPDSQFSHGYAYQSKPPPSEEGFYPSVLLHSPNWLRFAWTAEKWIFERLGHVPQDKEPSDG